MQRARISSKWTLNNIQSVCNTMHKLHNLRVSSANIQSCRHVRTINSTDQQIQAQSENISQNDIGVLPKGWKSPFVHAKTGNFAQDAPQLHNQFAQDSLLQGYLRRHVSEQYLSEMMSKLTIFGERVTGDIYQLSLRMEAEPPRLEQIDAWGHRVDRLITSSAWQKMKEISAEEGLISSGYERDFGQWSRLYQMCQFYLFEPSGGLYGCPLAMTNGAACTIELLADSHPWLYNRAFPHLTSRDPEQFWTSGQWMTEKRGGSDVAGGTETVAVEQTDGTYKLYGYKWFSSATDADVTLTLARVIDRQGNVVKGTRGLSLFYVEVKDQGRAIQMVKLKNKLGTRQLPTAELLIDGATGFKVSEEGRGVSAISQMLTLTRIHTAVHAAAAMRRIVNLARDYACRRRAFGELLVDHPLHIHTLATMEVETRAAAIFVLEASRLLGRQETLEPSEELQAEKDVLRIIVPLLKLYVSKKSVSVISEGLECFGGQGYIEDTDIPRLLRDVQVTPIWEGTTNILSLDVLRAVRKSSTSSSELPPVLVNFQQDVCARLSKAKQVIELEASAAKVESSLDALLRCWLGLHPRQQEMAAREISFSLARIYMGGLLVEYAAHHQASEVDVYTAKRWCEQDLAPLCAKVKTDSFTPTAKNCNKELVFDGFNRYN